MKHWNRLFSVMLTLCLLTCFGSSALAAQTADFEALTPLMDFVATAAVSAGETPESIGDESTTLSPAFIGAFFSNAAAADASLGLSADMLGDTERQRSALASIFAAQLPELTAIPQAAPAVDSIGFQPVTINSSTDSGVQIIGELYRAGKKLSQLTAAEFASVQWLDRAVFTFRSDSSARGGYRLTGFSVGSELNMEEAMQDYYESILMEYVNTNLGFEIQYPSVFADTLLQESADGVSAKLPDGSAAFFVKRIENTAHANLADYVGVIASGLPGATAAVNEDFNCATITYPTADGQIVFDVYIVTDRYVYQAEMSYQQSLAAAYSMYADYLENSFLVYEINVG